MLDTEEINLILKETVLGLPLLIDNQEAKQLRKDIEDEISSKPGVVIIPFELPLVDPVSAKEKSCGANAPGGGGFQKNNDCAKGDAGASKKTKVLNDLGIDPATSDHEIGLLAGTVDESETTVKYQNDRVVITSSSDEYRATRYVQKHGDYTYINNVEFEVKPEYRGKGLATELISNQVKQATKLGIKKIGAIADDGGGNVGFYVWPRLGFDGEIDWERIQMEFADPLPKWTSERGKLSEVMDSDDSREWWKKHGRSVVVWFDLAKGSKSRKTLAEQVKKRRLAHFAAPWMKSEKKSVGDSHGEWDLVFKSECGANTGPGGHKFGEGNTCAKGSDSEMVRSEKVEPDKYVNPENVEPVNKTEPSKVDRIAKDMQENGFTGRPILLLREGVAITGSHRIVAARVSDTKLPIVLIDDEIAGVKNEDGEMFGELLEQSLDDEDRADVAKSFESVFEKSELAERFRDISDLLIAEDDFNLDSFDRKKSIQGMSSESFPVESPVAKADILKPSLLMFPLPDRLVERVKQLHGEILPSDLAEKGLETDPHITIKFGLHTQNPVDVISRIGDFGQVSITIGSSSIFEADEYDVVKLDVEGESLINLNKIASSLPHTSTHKDYHPHITIGYVKKGAGKKYVGKLDGLKGAHCSFDEYQFRDGEKKKRTLGLDGSSR
jgi:2'-5' RNA ligase/GNAT superfamily N-acetyltransferase